MRLSYLAFTLLLVLIGCDGTSPEDNGSIVAGIDFDELFAPPTSAEINAVLDDWAGRDVSAQDLTELDTVALAVRGTPMALRFVSHDVGGVTHYGAILAPDGATPGSLPVAVYAHGGDGGASLDAFLSTLALVLPGLQEQFVFVIPSFRAEPLTYGTTDYLSGGEPSPWDRDVDDTLALLNATLASTPVADAERIGVVGFSRGGGVGLLMAARDPRIDLVVEFFGPTDFFGEFVQDVTREALLGTLRDLPGLDYLNAAVIQPLKNGTLSIAEARAQMVRRSAVYFADRLPPTQLHHGTADQTVPVSQGERLIEVMADLGRTPPDFEQYLYEGAGHNPLAMPGSFDRTAAFLGRLSHTE